MKFKNKTKTGLCRKGSDNCLSEYWNTYYSIFICGQLLSIKSSHYIGVQKNIITMYADCSVCLVLKSYSYLICAEKVCSDDCQAENESNPWVARIDGPQHLKRIGRRETAREIVIFALLQVRVVGR